MHLVIYEYRNVESVRIITFVLSPFPIGWCFVQNTTQWSELIDRDVISRDAKFIEQLPLSSVPHTFETRK